MSYDLMLLADPGPERNVLLNTLAATEGIRPDSGVENRYWLAAPNGEVQINVGSKDPVESVHCLIESRDPVLLEAATLKVLELGHRLEMRLEDVQWGYEVTAEDLPRLRQYWRDLPPPVTAPERDIAPARPWWRVW